MSSKRKLVMPTAKEEAAINAGIKADPDTMVMGDEQFAAAAAAKRARGRPAGSVKDDAKKSVSIRLDPALLQAMRDTGKGWQTRAQAALRREFLAAPQEPTRAAAPVRKTPRVRVI